MQDHGPYVDPPLGSVMDIGNRVGRGLFKMLILFPGMIIQWVIYMFVGKVKGYGMVRQQTRLSRSPFMKWVCSIGAWDIRFIF